MSQLYWILGVCAMTPVGAFVGQVLLGGIPPSALAFVLGFGSGTFLFITCVGVIPELMADKRHRSVALVSIAAGYLVFLISDTLFHAH
jgi:zinc transporter ZupT